MLFSPDRRRQPGPKGPSAELILAVVEMKQRNPNWGCPRIAQQMALAFHLQIDKDVVRRILGHHYQPGHSSGDTSWLTFLGHMKDSLWSMDLFRCESATLQTHWVLVVMDQYTRRIIGFGVHAGDVDGVTLCRMFNRAIRGPADGPILRGVKGGPLELNMLAKRVIRPALRNRENYRNGESKNWKPLEWQGFYSLRRGIATQLTAITRDPMAAKGLLRHSSVNTTLAHYIKDVPEVTANGMAQVEQLFDKLDAGEQVVQ